MKAIRLMADYQCFPLWDETADCVGNIDPGTLPISEQLKEQLRQWASLYDATLNPDDPLVSGFCDATAEAAFKEFGCELRERLQAELGPDVKVSLRT